MNDRRRYPWKVFFVLAGAAVATAPLVLLYALDLMRAAPNPPEMPASGLSLVPIAMLRAVIVIVPATGLGLLLACSKRPDEVEKRYRIVLPVQDCRPPHRL